MNEKEKKTNVKVYDQYFQTRCYVAQDYSDEFKRVNEFQIVKRYNLFDLPTGIFFFFFLNIFFFYSLIYFQNSQNPS